MSKPKLTCQELSDLVCFMTKIKQDNDITNFTSAINAKNDIELFVIKMR